MKKVFIVFVLALVMLLSVKVAAATPNYSTTISDTTSIAEDFKEMNVSLDSFTCKTPDNYVDYFSDLNQFNLFDFQVVKLNEEEARIYLYVHCPLKYDRSQNDYIEAFFVTYDIENYDFSDPSENHNYNAMEVAYDDVHGIFKLRCNKFKYSASNKITISSIIGHMALVGHKITCLPNLTKEFIFKDNFISDLPLPNEPDKISKTSSIADDFKLLNMNIDDYYIPKNYDYCKWYVVAMGFEINDDSKIQSYFYIYNPTPTATTAFEIIYKLNNVQFYDYYYLLKTDAEHGLYKVEGFTLDYSNTTQNISLVSIATDETFSESEFELEVTFDNTSENEVSIKSKFNSTIIIDDIKVVQIEVKKDDNFINNWNDFWTCSTASMYVFFYNFNFPDHIKYDSVEYAKFQYEYLYYYEKVWLDEWDFSPDPELSDYNEKKLIEKETVVSEYNNDSKKLRVNKHSQELTFPTFYLGNRIKDKQFGTLDVSGELDSFDYDCSILLDSTYKTTERWSGYYAPFKGGVYNDINYTVLDKVDLVELHYEKDGVLYKCQVVSKPVEKDDFDQGTATSPTDEDDSQKSIWDKIKEILIKIVDWILNNVFQTDSNAFPEIAKLAIGFVLCVVSLIVTPYIIKFLIYVIKLPFKIFKK